MDLGIVIIIVLMIVMLAILAESLEIEFSKDGVFPRMSIKFKKDSTFFSLLKKSPSINIPNEKSFEEESVDLGYVTKFYEGRVSVKYGDDNDTVLEMNQLITATEDNIDEYYYFTHTNDIKLKRLEGFIRNDNDYHNIYDLPHWTGNEGKGRLAGLFRVTLKILRLTKGENYRIRFNTSQKVHYKETLSDATVVYHFYYFRMITEVLSSSLIFSIPKGKVSKIDRYIVSVENNENSIEKEYKFNNEEIHDIGSGYGTLLIKEKENIEFIWSIPTTLPQGTVCKLTWYTKRIS